MDILKGFHMENLWIFCKILLIFLSVTGIWYYIITGCSVLTVHRITLLYTQEFNNNYIIVITIIQAIWAVMLVFHFKTFFGGKHFNTRYTNDLNPYSRKHNRSYNFFQNHCQSIHCYKI